MQLGKKVANLYIRYFANMIFSPELLAVLYSTL